MKTALLSLLLLTSANMQANANGGTDNPEPAKQGETLPGEARVLEKPYSEGVIRVGHNALNGRSGNLAMTWSGQCAYVADGLSFNENGVIQTEARGPHSGVAVVDVRNPAAPTVTRYLTDKGSLNATETIHAVQAKDRTILATSTYGGVPGLSAPKEGWLSLYDVADCANPRLLSEIIWPEPVHTLTISPDGQFVYGTILNPFTGDGGIAVMDIADMKKPHFVGKFAVTRPDGSSYAFAPHQLEFRADSKRIFVGVVASKGGDLEAHKIGKSGMPSAESVGPDAGGVYILDNSEIAARRPDARLRLISVIPKAGWHSPVRARIGGKSYIVNAGELGACPGAWPRIANIDDERKPKIVGEFRLAMNRPENCPPRTAFENASGGIVGRAGAATTHFQDVDDPDNTKLGLFSFAWAGMRIVDLRKPDAPVEIAYFKPGDFCGSKARYVRKTRHIWFACSLSGFHVIALKSKLRNARNSPKS